MSNTKCDGHTPGPWKASNLGDNGKFSWIVEGPNGSHVTDYLLEPNARLIAAAPDLLAACKAMIHASLSEYEAAIKAARAAIARAEGGAS